MFKKKGLILSVLLLIISILALTACGSTEKVDSKNESNKVKEEEVVKEYTPGTITHELGEATLEKVPEKLIVFDYGVLDAMDKMDIEPVGLPKGSLPSYLEKYKDDRYADLGSLKEPNFEKIYELNPDLIIISGRQANMYDEFKKIAPTVYLAIDGSNYMDSFKNNMKTLGKIFDKEDFVEKEIKAVEDSIKELNEKVTAAGENALIIMANDGSLSGYGEGSRFGIIHKEFGFEPVDKNIDSKTHGKNISFEYIVEQNPDYLLVIDRGSAIGENATAKQVLDNDLIKSTDTFKNDRIVYLNSEVWYLASGGFTGTKMMVEDLLSAIK